MFKINYYDIVYEKLLHVIIIKNLIIFLNYKFKFNNFKPIIKYSSFLIIIFKKFILILVSANE